MESDLIRLAQAGDDAAFETLMRQHQEAVFRLAYLLLGDTDEAEDTAQETFIRAHRYLKRFDGVRPLRPWLLRITANLAHNRRRALGRYFNAVQRMFRDNPTARNIETESRERWESQELWEAVCKLSSDDQKVIYLRFFLELPIAETAEILDVAEGTVKSRLNRALKRLKGVVLRDFPLLYEGENYD